MHGPGCPVAPIEQVGGGIGHVGIAHGGGGGGGDAGQLRAAQGVDDARGGSIRIGIISVSLGNILLLTLHKSYTNFV